MYSAAGNIFKMHQKWNDAGDAYLKSAGTYEQSKDHTDSCNMYQNAASCFRKENPEKAIECYNASIRYMLKAGRFSSAAKLQKEVGEIYETQMFDYNSAIAAYSEAGQLFLGEESKALASDCILRAAKASCEGTNTMRSLELFQKLVDVSSTSDYAQYIIKDYLFGICLCLLIVRNESQAEQEIAKVIERFPYFQQEREFELIESLKEAIKKQDIAEFQAAVERINEFSKLGNPGNNWKTTLLLRIQSKIQEEPSLA